jgi:hypothetical protein
MTHSTNIANQARDALWRGAPLPDELMLATPPASAPVRAAIYAAARTQAVAQAVRAASWWARAWQLLCSQRAQAAWATCAVAVVVACVWLSPTARAPHMAGIAPVDEFVSGALAVCDADTFAPLTEATGVDPQDDSLHADLQQTAIAIAWLEDDLQLDIFASNY